MGFFFFKLRDSLILAAEIKSLFSFEEFVFPELEASLCLRAGDCLLAVDLVVLRRDGVEGLVPVDHGAKNHRLQGRQK